MATRRLSLMETGHPSPTVAAAVTHLISNIERVILGKREVLELAIAALLSGGHILLQDVPGVGKTMLARALGRSIGGEVARIQCTPDLLPSDITGTTVLDRAPGGAGMGEVAMRFVPGPIFANVVLADELNRATPRTQAALLEALDEGQVTIDGRSRELPRPFFLMATLNPVEHHGTYPLPEGQLDRFALSISLGYPAFDDELQMLVSHVARHPIDDLAPVLSASQVVELQSEVRAVHIGEAVHRYALNLVTRSRTDPRVVLGCSPRGAITLLRAAQARAAMDARSYVLPDDVKTLAPAVLSHRILLRPDTNVPAGTLVLAWLREVEIPLRPEFSRAHA